MEMITEIGTPYLSPSLYNFSISEAQCLIYGRTFGITLVYPLLRGLLPTMADHEEMKEDF